MHCEYYVWFAFSSNLCSLYVMCLNDVLYIKSSRRTVAFFRVFFFFFFAFWSWNIVPHRRQISCGFQASVCRTRRAVSASVSGRRRCRMALTDLLVLCLMLCPGALCLDPGGLNSCKFSHWICLQACCFHINFSFVAVWLSKPRVADVDAFSAKQMLLVSWLVNDGSLLGATSELQIGRTENHTIVHSVSQEGFTLHTFSSDSK